MTRGRRILSIVLAAVGALALTACAGLPTSGSVHPGLVAGEVEDSLDVIFRPNGPQAGMTPIQIVQGFIGAGTSPEGNWATAELFLADEFREEWKPDAGVKIAAPAAEDYEETAEGQVTLTITPTADVDATGAYSASEDAGATALPFQLAQREDGEWRIVDAPDGIVLERGFFVSVFHAYPLMYFDPSGQFLVPDVRWFPPRNNPATRIARELINGDPSPWLAASVVPAFPDDVDLAASAVPVDSNRVATVELSGTALSVDQDVRDRMQAQLEASLAAAGVTTVDMSVGGTTLEATAVPTRSTRIDTRPLVLTEAGLGLLSGDVVESIGGLTDAIPAALGSAPTAIEVTAGRDAAAVQVATGAVARVLADGTVNETDTRAGLIAPSIDPYGYVWSVPGADPTAVLAAGEGTPAAPVAGAWPGASQIGSMRVSRDGTRVAAVITVGGQHWAAVAGIVRNADRVPVALGEAFRLTRLAGSGVAVTWLDDATIGIVSAVEDGTVVIEQVVGGEATGTDGPAGATALAGTTAAVRLRAEDGVLYLRRGAAWSRTAPGVLVLATQQGMLR